MTKTSPLWNRIVSKWSTEGPSSVIRAAYRRFVPIRIRHLDRIRDLVRDKKGLEIGGPSKLFGPHGLIPIYSVVERVDNCNFSASTVWEGDIRDGQTFRFDPSKPAGWQYISEATELREVATETYDFLLSSHTIEHTANPLKALIEWKRVLKDNGILILVVPHRDGTFDHQRPITTMEHLREDHRQDRGEDDLTHMEEVLELHVGWPKNHEDSNFFRNRSLANIENRCLHHHVFHTPLVVEILDHLDFEILEVESSRPYNIVAVARKLPEGQRPENRTMMSQQADYRRRSPFPSDSAPVSPSSAVNLGSGVSGQR